MKEGYVCLGFQPKCYNERFKSIEQISHVLFKYKPKTNVKLLKHFKMAYFHWGAKILLKTLNNWFFFCTHVFYISFQWRFVI
jgi:hypothetical protein